VKKLHNQNLRDPTWSINYRKIESRPRNFPGFRCLRVAGRSFGVKELETLYPSGVGTFYRLDSFNCIEERLHSHTQCARLGTCITAKGNTQIHERIRGYIHGGGREYTLDDTNTFAVLR